MIGINNISEVLIEIKKNDALYMYLVNNAIWYEILNNDPSRYKNFVNTAQKDLKITFTDKVNNIRNGIDFFYELSKYSGE